MSSSRVAESPVKKRARLASTGVEELTEDLSRVKTYDKLLLLMDQALIHHPEILRLIKEKIKCFSGWNIEDASAFFHIGSAGVPVYTPSKVPHVPSTLLETIAERLEEDLLVAGAWNAGSETRRNSTIDCIMKPILKLFKGNVQVKYEGSLESMVASGRVEFVVYALEDVIMYVIETKKEDFAQGMAQLFMQLHAADTMNRVEGLQVTPLCGVVTTGQRWQFFVFDSSKSRGQQFSESEVYSLRFSFDSIKLIVSIILHDFLRLYRDSCVALRNSWARECRDSTTSTIDWNQAAKQEREVMINDTLVLTYAANLHHLSCPSLELEDPVVKKGTAQTSITFAEEGMVAFKCTKHARHQLIVSVLGDPNKEVEAAAARANAAQRVFDTLMKAASPEEGDKAFVELANTIPPSFQALKRDG